MTSRPQPIDWLVMAFPVIAWGVAYAALKVAVEYISPLWNAALRLWIAVAALARRGPMPPSTRP